jgi:hypothetical protein
MRAISELQSGKRGAIVSFHSRYGQIQRQYVKPRNPKTPAQMRIRANLARFAAGWRGLTEERRVAWTITARDGRSQRRLGHSSYLTGCQLYIKINSARAAIGLGPLQDPPEPPKFGDNPVGALVITNDNGKISLKLKVSGTSNAAIVVLGVGPRSAGVSYAWNFVTIGLMPAASRGLSDITDLYVARFGVPAPGTRVFIRTRQQINGWEDLPLQINALVPKA